MQTRLLWITIVVLLLAVAVMGTLLATAPGREAADSSPDPESSEPTQPRSEPTPTSTESASPTPTAEPTATPTPTAVPVQIANGTIFTADTFGLGELTVENGTTTDAIVKLIRASDRTTVRSFYVVRQSSWTITDVPPGWHLVLFATGLDWDPILLRFQRERGFSEFEEGFEFTETEDSEGTYYSTWSITLHPVVGGSAETEEISEDAFGTP